MSNEKTFRLILKDSEGRAVMTDIELENCPEKLHKQYTDLLKQEEKARNQSETNDKEVADRQAKEQEKKQDRIEMDDKEYFEKYPEDKPEEKEED